MGYISKVSVSKTESILGNELVPNTRLMGHIHFGFVFVFHAESVVLFVGFVELAGYLDLLLMEGRDLWCH